MTALTSLFLTIVLATHRWGWRPRLAVGGAGVLMGLFVMCWLTVQALHLPDMTAVFYGHGASPPTPVLWMNLARGGGIVYIAAWGLVEFHHLLRSARRPYERGVASVAIVLYVLTGVPGLMTMLESVARHRGLDMAVMQQVRITFTVLVLTGTAVMLAVQIWLWPLWHHRRQLLARYIEPELVQLRHDLLNLSAAEAELHLDIHHENYANHAIVEAVAVRCRAVGISPARTAIARMAASLITFHRDNVMQDTSYGLVTSWEALMAEAAAEIDQAMALTAWEKALRDGYIAQHVYRIMFLVLESRAYRERLLIDERPRVEAWHQQLADLIATVMHAHGHATPRYETMAGRALPARRLARLRHAWRPLAWRIAGLSAPRAPPERGRPVHMRGPAATCDGHRPYSRHQSGCVVPPLRQGYGGEADQGAEDRHERLSQLPRPGQCLPMSARTRRTMGGGAADRARDDELMFV
jgi:hypothetical protein